MTAPAPPPSAPADSDSLDGWERALLDRQLEALGRLADMGMAMAAAIARRATAEEAGPDAAPQDSALQGADLAHAAMDFARVSRAVRMTFALQSRLIADFKGGAARSAGAEPADDGPLKVRWGRPDVVEHDEVQKRQVRGIVQRLAEAASLEREAVERLEDDRVYRDLTERPLGEIVALFCKDLGVAPDWDLLADTYWAQLEIKRPPPGSPYAGWKAARAPWPDGASAPPPALVPSG